MAAALDFPLSPSINDVYVANGNRWQWNGSSWKRLGQPGPQGTQGIQGVQGVQGIQGIQGSTFNRDEYGFVATEGQTNFSVNYAAIGSMDVFVNGVHLTTTEYTTSGGNTLILNDPLVAGDIVDVITFESAGPQGTDGTQGIQGITGSGTQGVQGTTGAQGTDGAQGTTGTGTQGTTGAQGTDGTQGTTGAQGTDGTQGTTGPVAGSANQVVFKDGSNNPAGSANLTFDGSTLSASAISVSGNATIGGTLTYEDVINVDSVGIATARAGLRITGGGLDVVGVATFNNGVDTLDVIGHAEVDQLRVSGVSTFNNNVSLGGTSGVSNITGLSRLELYDNAANIVIGNPQTADYIDLSLSKTIENIFIGLNAGQYFEQGNGNNIIGFSAGQQGVVGASDYAYFNNIIGYNAVQNLTSGSYNQAIGEGSLQNLTSGDRNIAIGNYPGFAVTTGDHNILLGDDANVTNGSDSYNIVIGKGITVNGNNNLAIGINGEKLITGVRDGAVELYYNNLKKFETTGYGVTVSGGLNVSGVSTFVGIVTSQSDVFVGNDLSVAGDARVVGVLTVGSSSITINGDTNTINVGTGATIHTTTASFNQLEVAGVSTFVGNVFAQGTVQAADFNTTSDERYKENIAVIDDPIGKVSQIRGVTFDWIESQGGTPSAGIIAQEVEVVMPRLVCGDTKKGVNYNGLVGLLIEVVKEQQQKIEELEQRISALE